MDCNHMGPWQEFGLNIRLAVDGIAENLHLPEPPPVFAPGVADHDKHARSFEAGPRASLTRKEKRVKKKRRKMAAASKKRNRK